MKKKIIKFFIRIIPSILIWLVGGLLWLCALYCGIKNDMPNIFDCICMLSTIILALLAGFKIQEKVEKLID